MQYWKGRVLLHSLNNLQQHIVREGCNICSYNAVLEYIFYAILDLYVPKASPRLTPYRLRRKAS